MTVLKGDLATKQSIALIDAFKQRKSLKKSWSAKISHQVGAVQENYHTHLLNKVLYMLMTVLKGDARLWTCQNIWLQY